MPKNKKPEVRKAWWPGGPEGVSVGRAFYSYDDAAMCSAIACGKCHKPFAVAILRYSDHLKRERRIRELERMTQTVPAIIDMVEELRKNWEKRPHPENWALVAFDQVLMKLRGQWKQKQCPPTRLTRGGGGWC